MALHLVSIPSQNFEESTLAEAFGEDNFIKLWDQLFFVDTKISTTEICRKLEITPSGLGLAMIVPTGSFSGRASGEVIEWLRARSQS